MAEPRVTYRGVIYPWECDTMGHFTTRNYMVMFDDAGWHFLHEIGYDPKWITEKRIGWADVNHNIEYLKEVHAGALVLIESKPLRIGGKSVEFQMEMKSVKGDETYARLTAVTVQFDLEKRCAIPVLDEIREKVVAWLDDAA